MNNSNEKLTRSTVVSQSDNLIAQDIDGDLVVMHLDTDEYYGMQSIANRIWQLIESPMPVSQLVDVLAAEYNADHAAVEADVMEFLQELLTEGLIQTGDASG